MCIELFALLSIESEQHYMKWLEEIRAQLMENYREKWHIGQWDVHSMIVHTDLTIIDTAINDTKVSYVDWDEKKENEFRYGTWNSVNTHRWCLQC